MLDAAGPAHAWTHDCWWPQSLQTCCSEIAAQTLLHTSKRLQAEGCGPPEVATCGRDGAVRVWDVRQQDAPVAAFEPAPGEEVGYAPACTKLCWWQPPGHTLMKDWVHMCGSPGARSGMRWGTCCCCMGSHHVAAFAPAPEQVGGLVADICWWQPLGHRLAEC